jgi:MFS family permease
VQYALLAGTAFLARRFGTLPVYRASVIAFTAASALCALAPGAGVLVGARIVQGLVAAPLVQPLRPDQLGDANTLFNTWQRIAGSFGIGLVAALYATRARTLGPVAALHPAGLVLVMIAVAGALGALVLPAVRGTAMARLTPPGQAPLLGYVCGRVGDHAHMRAEVLQVLVHPQQARMMRGGDDADQGPSLFQPVRVTGRSRHHRHRTGLAVPGP